DQTAESSAGAGTQPAGCGGESNEFEVLTKASKGYALILPNPMYDIECTLSMENSLQSFLRHLQLRRVFAHQSEVEEHCFIFC
ncbi:MAG: hypothetical protein ABIN36_00085, partial [Ferruginibacter sp.]